MKRYLSLISELAITGFKLKYNGSFFGYLWSLANPLMYFLVLYFVFTRVFDLGDSIKNYPLYLLLGVTIWGFFAEATSVCMNSIVSNGDLIRKVYFPRIVLPIASSLSTFINLMLNLVVVFAFALVLHVDLTTKIMFIPLYLIEIYFFTLGVSLFLAALFVKFRDIGPIWGVAMQVLFYATPIIYPITLVPDRYLKLMMVSPLAQIIQGFRYSLMSNDIGTSSGTLGIFAFLPVFITLAVFLLGYFSFQKMAAKFAENV
ncbi:TPA: hypothetical protein DDW69_00925 [candidate division CPR2 bacterium]|uniref:Transport permease protein n=1 Tax=candidate division CPR2 bacterium GW2011_GWC1_41_48 TaxID=1618344 RepID=A0A0G0Z9B0_UNCC2|nr:MAG: Polysaccharide ABC superfamily ATP binding cassette transporter permease [candidate division CPR2 bacterium GW2011_GWC2_39_35]KKR28745.1 MAG: Polysaccharide ABC superfamily ATP binding cassette transporter permease [candidate division CPR2 bacterium GW2011_GWD2_39_7]KKS09598.1 MAG: Polysaccharide ABC superfamily ATP binding cassette transporter permease [candidate division CPR2 bacterium GW2011_GWC1_41_48]OGB73136.1 MAG: hypothetical protein A2Y26_03095 [candidate division CPR2 bacterium